MEEAKPKEKLKLSVDISKIKQVKKAEGPKSLQALLESKQKEIAGLEEKLKQADALLDELRNKCDELTEINESQEAENIELKNKLEEIQKKPVQKIEINTAEYDKLKKERDTLKQKHLSEIQAYGKLIDLRENKIRELDELLSEKKDEFAEVQKKAISLEKQVAESNEKLQKEQDKYFEIQENVKSIEIMLSKLIQEINNAETCFEEERSFWREKIKIEGPDSI